MDHTPAEYTPFPDHLVKDCTPPLTRGNSVSSTIGENSSDELSSLVETTSKLYVSERPLKAAGPFQSRLTRPTLVINPDVYTPEAPRERIIYDEPGSFFGSDTDHVVYDAPESYDDDGGITTTEVSDYQIPRRKALLIGISYARNDDINSLAGSHRDVEDVRELLQEVHGWDASCFRVLKDDGLSTESQPTLKNIKFEIKNLVEDAHAGDRLFFYFAGHGGQIKDNDGDEVDALDEVLVTCDGQQLVDDELHEILVKPVPRGCRLTALLDCCSSGTGLDLPFNAITPKQTFFPDRPFVRKQSDGDVVLLSACKDSQKAWEMNGNGGGPGRGLLTHAFTHIMKTTKKHTYGSILKSVGTLLHERGPKEEAQSPQLSCSHIIDMNGSFDL